MTPSHDIDAIAKAKTDLGDGALPPGESAELRRLGGWRRHECPQIVALTLLAVIASPSSVAAQASGSVSAIAGYSAVPGYGTGPAQGNYEFSISSSASAGGGAAWGNATSMNGAFSATAQAHARSGPQISSWWENMGQAHVWLERQVCLVPVDSTLLGTTARVSFGAASASATVDANLSVDPLGGGAVTGALVSCDYSINNQFAGAYTRTKGIRADGYEPPFYDLTDTAVPDPIPTVTLGVPFTIRMHGLVYAYSGSMPHDGGAGVHQSTGEASASGSFSLGLPSVLAASGDSITAYTWMDCGATGLPISPNPPQVFPFFVMPNHGPNTGMTGVILTGVDFTDTTEVLFGAVPVAFTVDSDGQITVDLAPTSTTGYVDVSVTNSLGTRTVVDGFHFFTPPADVGTACGAPYLTWSGIPTLGREFTVTTQNLGTATQRLLVDWSNVNAPWRTHVNKRGSGCPILLDADSSIDLGTSQSYTFAIPYDTNLVGVHLRIQAVVLGPQWKTTQLLDTVIGE